MAPACSKLDAKDGLDDIFRRVARKFPEVTDWLCPITGRLMKDPVTAKDGFNYERSAITDWFAKVGKVSPQTKKEMGEELEGNEDLRAAIEKFKSFVHADEVALDLSWEHHGMCSGKRNVMISRDDVCKEQPVEELQMCQALSKFFKELDPIEDLLRRMLHGLKAPKIVVVGDESAGKSTILEMLAMIPFFPRKLSCCTRMAIHVCMRRTPGVSRATLKVLSENSEVDREIPQENGWLVVEEEMERLQQDGISQKTLVVKVERPDVPCLDLVDLPGMTQWPHEKAEQVRKIYQRQVEDDRNSGNQSMYLAVVQASGIPRPAGTSVVPFIMEEGLQDRTVGVFSKVDENSNADVLRALTLNEKTDKDEPPESLGAVHLSKGWLATMLKPPADDHFKYHNYERMYLQQKEEMDWFRNPDTPERKKHWPKLVEKKSAGIADLVPRVEQLYLENLQNNWKEYAMLRILEKEATTQFDLNMLGVVQDPDEKQRLAKEEVHRRIGPNSSVTENAYNSFIEEVLHQRLVPEVERILEDFDGKPCPGHALPQKLKDMKERFLGLMEGILVPLDTCMVDAVRDILLAESELCEDGPGDFNLRTASLRRYAKGSCASKREVEEKLQEEPIIQLCHFEDFVNSIMEKYTQMLRERKQSLRESLESLITRLADVDFPSPYLQVKSSFSRNRSENTCTDSRVNILHLHCEGEKLVDALLQRCLQHVPHPDHLKDLYQDVPVGRESQQAREDFDRLRNELRLVVRAKESIIRALSIEDEDFRSIACKFQDAVADADSASVVTPSGAGSWEVVTSPRSSPTSEADGHSASSSPEAVWEELKAENPPSVRRCHTAIYEEKTSSMLVFGGYGSGKRLNDLWKLNTKVDEATGKIQAVWEELKAENPPSVRCCHTAIYEEKTSSMLVFGGYGSMNLLNDLWKMDVKVDEATGKSKAVWEELKAENPPPVRERHTAIYDKKTSSMLVFGGSAGGVSRLNDLWKLSTEVDEATGKSKAVWEELKAAPPVREFHTAIYDKKTSSILVFGGYGSNRLNDVWKLNTKVDEATGKIEAVWEEVKTENLPPVRHGHTAIYDKKTSSMLVFGGDHQGKGAGGKILNDLWKLDVKGFDSSDLRNKDALVATS